MPTEILSLLNLNKNETAVYSLLLKNGAKTVKELTKLSELTRTNLYNVLTGLEKIGLIEQNKNSAKSVFTPVHPNKLTEIIENKEKSLKLARVNLEATLPSLISDYNLAIGKPGIRFYEGCEAMEQILADQLKAKTEILQYLDPSITDLHYKKENDDFVKKRLKAGLKKKMLVKNTPANRQRFNQRLSEFTETRYLDAPLSDFHLSMQIYDNKISYLTLEPERMIGVIIEDKLIASLHRDLFLAQWESALSDRGATSGRLEG